MLLFVLFLAMVRIATTKNCSALHSYVQVTATSPDWSSPLVNILMSSQALFPPHSYYVPQTPLIALPKTDPICDANPILSADLSNKVVLLFESQGNCSVHSKVITAQRKGAVAVLMANDESADKVVNIMDDNTLSHLHTTIPMRSITQEDGKWLRRSAKPHLQIHVEVKFGCFGDVSYPSLLCVRDMSGARWSVNGEYQRQADVQINGHPVWKLNGYPSNFKPLYIFLHDANGDADWFWAVTHDASFADDSALVLRCEVGDISEPSLCPSWSGFDINITTTACPAHKHQEFCLDTSQSQFAGTYALVTDGVSEWVRKSNECDERPAILMFMEHGVYQGGFVVYDPLTDWVSAYCVISQPLHENIAYGTRRYRPDLCTEWKKANGTEEYSYLQQYQSDDSMFHISMGACVESADSCVASKAPDTFCMADNSMFHGHLMGEYRKLNGIESHSAAPIYKRVRAKDESAKDPSAFVWYRDAILDHDHPHGWYLTDSIEHDEGFEYYGYCEGYAFGNPVNCVGWVFEVGWTLHYDNEMTVSEGQCTENLPAPHPDHGTPTWPEFVCIGLKNESIDYENNMDSDVSVLVGRYEMDTSYRTEEDRYPVWNKEDDDMHLSFTSDKLWRISEWSEDDKVRNESVYEIQCDAYYKTTSLNPTDCQKWMDWNFAVMDEMYLYECTKQIDSKQDTDAMVAIVIGIVFAILCIVGVIVLCSAYRMKKVFEKKDTADTVVMDNLDHIHLASLSPMTVTSTDNVHFNIEI